MDDNKIFTLIKKSLKTSKEINAKSNSQNVEEWDSLGQLSILSSLDKATKGKSSKISSLAEAYSVKKIQTILNKNKI
jgi:acyl carrier protein